MLVIRKATLKDVNTIVTLFEEFMKDTDAIILKENPSFKPYLIKEKNALLNFRAFIKKNIRSKNSIVNIAEVDGELAGYSLNYIKKNIPIFKLDKLGYISDLFVRKRFRGMKISSKFRDEAIKEFKKRGIKYISIVVNSGNLFAHSVYKKWGFSDYHIEMRMKI